MPIDLARLFDAISSQDSNLATTGVQILTRELARDPALIEEAALSGMARVTTVGGQERLVGVLSRYVETYPSVRSLFLDVAIDQAVGDGARAAAIRGLRPVAHEDDVTAALMGAGRIGLGEWAQRAHLEVASRFARTPEVTEYLAGHIPTGGSPLEARVRDNAVAALSSMYPEPDPSRPQPLRLLGSEDERADAARLLDQLREALLDVYDLLPPEVAAVFDTRVMPALSAVQDALGTSVPTESALASLAKQAAGHAWEVVGAVNVAVGLLVGGDVAAERVGHLAAAVAEFVPIATQFVM